MARYCRCLGLRLAGKELVQIGLEGRGQTVGRELGDIRIQAAGNPGYWAQDKETSFVRFKRVSYFSDTRVRISGARGDCHSVPYRSLWTCHFFIFLIIRLHIHVSLAEKSTWLRTRWSGVRISPGAPFFNGLSYISRNHIS